MTEAYLTKHCLRACTRLALGAAALGMIVAMPAFAKNTPVSPGDLVETVPVATSCPTFSWSTESKSGIELVVAPMAAPEETVLSQELPPGATSWTPAADRCLEPGQYLWFFRPLNKADNAWSDSLTFEVSALPTLDEVERARQVLERFVEMGGAYQAVPAQAGSPQSRSKGVTEPVSTRASTSPAPGTPGNSSLQATANQATANQAVAISDAAISGYYPGASGSLAGVAGTVDTADGAGVVAENTADGADLMLAGPVIAEVSENRWLLDDAGAQVFDFSNPSGNLTLRVNGLDVLTTANSGGIEPPSMFGTFGGTSNTDRTISGTENLGTTVGLYHNLTVPAGTTLVINDPVAMIAVSGTCNIAGTITTVGNGRAGGLGASGAGEIPGRPGVRSNLSGSGYGMVGGLHRVPVDLAISGGGGGGGGAGDAPQARGGDGGGSEARGGEGGYPEFGTLEGRPAGNGWGQRRLMTAGQEFSNKSGLHSDFFSHFLYYPGAGGGAGAVGESGGSGGNGGNGAGNIYLECRSTSFTGFIDVSGEDGAPGTGHAGGGGGGGGGVALIRTLEVVENSGTLNGAGGTGGAGAGGGGVGGNGRSGYIDIVDL